jgi:hypothetical protein
MNTTKTTTTETLTCECGTIYQWENEEFRNEFWTNFFRPKHCEECSERIAAEELKRREEHERRKAEQELTQAKETTANEARDLIPPRYQQTDPKHPTFNGDLWRKVKAWRPSEEVPFLGMIGESGACKTRIGFMLWREIIAELVRPYGEPDRRRIYVPSFEAVTSATFARIVGSQFQSTPTKRNWWSDSNSDPRHEAREELDLFRKCEVLFLDDLGKAKNTPSVAAELFAIIDHRHAHNLTTIWTANSTPEEIVIGMSEDMAGPLAGRLIECSTIVRA